MLQTILVYSLLFLIMYVLCYYASKQNKWWVVIVALIIYSIIFGLRYGVGADFFAYLHMYEQYRLSGGEFLLRSDVESGFLFIIKMLALRNVHYGWFFGIIAFLQIYLVFYSIKKDKYIYPFLIITFVLGCIWLSFSNGLRQILAMCIFWISLRCLSNKQLIWHYTLLCLAVLFHKSAVILFLVYPLLFFKEEWFVNIKIQLFLLFVSLVVMNLNMVDFLMNIFIYFSDLLHYEQYLETRYSHKIFADDISLGIGFYILLFIDILCIYFSSEVKQFFRHRFVVFVYNLYFVGILLHYAFLFYHLIARVNYYFYGFNFLFGAYVLVYLYHTKRVFYYILLCLYFLTFLGTLYGMETNTAMYLFNWEVSYKGFIG